MNEMVAMDEPVVEAPGMAELETTKEASEKSPPKSEVSGGESQAFMEPRSSEEAVSESIPGHFYLLLVTFVPKHQGNL